MKILTFALVMLISANVFAVERKSAISCYSESVTTHVDKTPIKMEFDSHNSSSDHFFSGKIDDKFNLVVEAIPAVIADENRSELTLLLSATVTVVGNPDIVFSVPYNHSAGPSSTLLDLNGKRIICNGLYVFFISEDYNDHYTRELAERHEVPAFSSPK